MMMMMLLGSHGRVVMWSSSVLQSSSIALSSEHAMQLQCTTALTRAFTSTPRRTIWVEGRSGGRSPDIRLYLTSLLFFLLLHRATKRYIVSVIDDSSERALIFQRVCVWSGYVLRPPGGAVSPPVERRVTNTSELMLCSSTERPAAPHTRASATHAKVQLNAALSETCATVVRKDLCTLFYTRHYFTPTRIHSPKKTRVFISRAAKAS